jgi:hypothetical protein
MAAHETSWVIELLFLYGGRTERFLIITVYVSENTCINLIVDCLRTCYCFGG